MLFVTVGIVILVASFVLALVSLVREQKSVSSKPHEPSAQPETPETNIEEPASQILEPVSKPQPVLQESKETVNASKSDVISRLEEQIEKAKTTEQVTSARPEEKTGKSTDEFWNEIMRDKEEDTATPREPFPWEQSAGSVPVQTQTSQVSNKTDEPADEPTTQSTGGVIRMSDLVKKP